MFPMSTGGRSFVSPDESDPEEWLNYYYSLADFLWKKRIKPNTIRICDKLVLARTDCAKAELVRYIQ